MLTALGMDDWIAPSIDDFVDVAVARASDREALAPLRRTLRARLQASPLTDMPRFVRDLEAAYREMWLAGDANDRRWRRRAGSVHRALEQLVDALAGLGRLQRHSRDAPSRRRGTPRR